MTEENKQPESETVKAESSPSRLDDKMMDVELRRFISKARRAGIPSEYLFVKEREISEMIEIGWCTKVLNASTIKYAQNLMATSKTWSKNNSVFIIGGGTCEERRKMSLILLSKMVLHNLDEISNIGVALSYSEILSVLNSFSDTRFSLANNMKTFKGLYIMEVNEDIPPRPTSDAVLLFNSILEHRRNHNLPTIMSLSSSTEDTELCFHLPRKWGDVFASLLKTPIENTKNVFFLKVK